MMDKFEKILDMIDHRDKYSDEEIRELLQDEECRKLYQTMQEVDSALLEGDLNAKKAGDKASAAVDVDAEWEKFDEAHFTKKATAFSWRKMAASVAGLVLVSGIAFAAIHTFIKKSQEPMLISSDKGNVEAVVTDSARQVATADSLQKSRTEKPAIHKTFENVAFDKMMVEIAAFYDMQVKFDNAEAKSLRLYYEWDSHSGIESIVKELNQFENVNIEVEGSTLVVK